MQLLERERTAAAELTGGDRLPRVRLAAVQATPLFLHREDTTERACEWILRAGCQGARFVVFPEGFIPGHPLWYHFFPATDPPATLWPPVCF